MQEAEITASELVETREDTPKMLDFADKALDQMPFARPPGVVVTGLFGVDFGRDDDFNAIRDEFIDKGLCPISAVRNQRVKIQVNDHSMSLDDVVALSGGQGHAQGIAQSIDGPMGFWC
jgi:hypothetical protein